MRNELSVPRSALTAKTRVSTNAIPVNPYGGLPARERQLQRRERWIDAGYRLFGTIGFAKTSIQALAEASSCAPRTFYQEFGSREALLGVMYERTQSRILLATVAAIHGADADPASFVHAGIDAYIAAITSIPNEARIVLLEVVGVSAGIEKLRHDIHLHHARELQAAILARCGTLNVEDPEVIMLALGSATHGLLVEWIVSRKKMDVDRIARGLYGLWLRGLSLA